MQKGPKLAKIKLKNAKLSILMPIFNLIDCKSINAPQKWFGKQNNTNYYLVRYRLAVGALKLAKRAKIGQNEGQKYESVNFEANFLFEAL